MKAASVGRRLFLALLALGAIPFLGAEPPATRKVIEGRTFVFRKGNAYEIVQGREKFFKTLYDPAFVHRRYRNRGGRVFALSDDGREFPVLRTFADGFEGAASLRDLIGPHRGWSGFTLQSPRARTVPDYVALRNRILSGASDFLDNRVEPSTVRPHAGRASLYLYSAAPTRSMICSKASLETGLAYFVRGDDFWYSAWYFIVEGQPLGLVDLECTYMDEGPGPRVLLSETGEPRVELKWADKPTYRAPRGIAVPRGQWFHLRVHYRLMDDDQGIVQLWLNDDKIIDVRGQTLPLPDTVLDRVEVGLTASPPGAPSALFLDDVAFGDKPPAPPR